MEGGEAGGDAGGGNDKPFLELPTKRRKQCAPQRREQFVGAIGNGNIQSADEVECFVRFIHQNNFNFIVQLQVMTLQPDPETATIPEELIVEVVHEDLLE